MSKNPGKNDFGEGQNFDEYKMVIYRSENLEEVKSFNLSPTNIYVLSSVVMIVLCAMIVSLIVFTPLKRLIPGYGQIEVTPEFVKIVEGVDELDAKIEAQSTYLNALQQLLSTGIKPSDAKSDTQPDQARVFSKTNRMGIDDFPRQEVELSGARTESPDSEYWLSLESQKVLNPVEGIISSEFDPSIKHFGVDILAPSQSPIIAIMDGFVINSGWDLETGYTIGIQHDGNFLSFYKHNSKLLKEKGTFVQAGEAVAIIGNTGTLSNGPHLHFEIWHNGKPINPKELVNFN